MSLSGHFVPFNFLNKDFVMLISSKEFQEIDYENISENLNKENRGISPADQIIEFDEIAKELAGQIEVTPRVEKSKNLILEIEILGKELLESYKELTQDAGSLFLTPAAEWFLDNFHIIEEQLRNIKRDLPKNYYNELPKISSGNRKGYPRVLILARTMVAKSDSKIDSESVIKLIDGFQTKTPLSIGELWAVPITLKVALLEALIPLVRAILETKKERIKANLFADEILETLGRHENPANEVVTLFNQCFCDSHKFKRAFIVQLIQRLRDQDPDLFRPMEWLEQTLIRCHTSTKDLIEKEHHRQAIDQVSISNIITSMRLFSTIDWHVFFEKVNLIDPILKNDPSNEYSEMDIETRDSYRKKIETLSRKSKLSEIEVAHKVLSKAREENIHIGQIFLREKLRAIENSISYERSIKESFSYLADKHPTLFYFVPFFGQVIFYYSLILSGQEIEDITTPLGVLLTLLMIIPLSELAIGLQNYLITLIRKPKRLPKMEYKHGVPEKYTTMVVIPCLYNDEKTIKELVSILEVHYLANQDENIYFSLLGDFIDSKNEKHESDEKLLELVTHEIYELNKRYPTSAMPKFYQFTRGRRFSESEKKWLGWERKRGKTEEFNYFLRGSKTTNYLPSNTNPSFLEKIKFIITLDADTQLPLQAARKLIGTITHPTNLPIMDLSKTKVIQGYGIIQPRISVSLVSAAQTRFAQIFSGNTGIDPYTTAVSDVYQDLFGEGTFTGKGIYAVDVFIAALKGRVPENSILSHDLFEGCFTRVGLATDIELIDDYPSSFESFVKRMHRWTRGDWQLLPWLMPKVPNDKGIKVRNDLPYVGRWKIFDNLRRSILAPATLIWLSFAWLILPGSSIVWTGIVVFSMSCPIFASFFQDMIKKKNIPWKEHFRNNIRLNRNRIEQVFLMVVFLPDVAFAQTDAIFRSCWRVFISRKNLLEWVTFAQTQKKNKKRGRWEALLTFGTFFSIMMSLVIFKLRPESFLIALPFLSSWLIGPYIAKGIEKQIPYPEEPLTKNQVESFRRYARLTWHFFETFAVPEENWLAPDNFQEDPSPVIAHRTSPTNIGLQILSNLSAYDLGYIGFGEFIERSERLFESIHKLEKLNGHFYNWYNTQNLEPLSPRYISTVDSGNLAGHLITFKQACLELAKSEYVNQNARIGLKDSFIILEEYVHQLEAVPHLLRSGSLKRLIKIIRSVLNRIDSIQYESILSELATSKKLIADFTDEQNKAWSEKTSRWIKSIENQLASYRNDENLNHIRSRLKLKTLAYQAHDLAHSMDFKFLYDEKRKIFSIGHNVSESRRDESFYDLLASESRLASYFAISKGDIPDEHWFRLGRQLTSAAGNRTLISWSATMFEYLMPLLVMKRYEETLLDQSYESVVTRQIDYGIQRQVPWGISEAGYNARDLQFNYQYGPFGVPGLGLKRGLRDELVVSPYSTVLASMIRPKEALINLERLEKNNVLGDFGFYESIDYTPERVPKNKKFVILQSYMAHHQGMSLLALNNLLNNSILQERFHSDARNQAIHLLLQERIPVVTEIIKPKAEDTHIESFIRATENHHTRVYTDPNLPTPVSQILSNGQYSVLVTTAGSGYSKFNDKMVLRWNEDPTMDHWGQYFFLKNTKTSKVWTAGFQPFGVKPKKYEAIFAEDKIDIYREDNNIITNTEIIVSSEDNVELRRLSLTNKSEENVEIEVTSYMEIALAKAADDMAHPAFSKLFIQTEFIPQFNALLAERRPKSTEEKELWGFHLVTMNGMTLSDIDFETDRSAFLGRGRSIHNPLAILERGSLSKKTGAVLDPIFSLRKKINLRNNETIQLIFVTGVAASRHEALVLAQKYHDQNLFSREISLAWVKAQIMLRHLNISMEKAHTYQRLGGRITFLSPYLRSSSKTSMENTKQQSALWAYGISGDNPIILIRVHQDKDVPFVRDLLHAHEYLKIKGIKSDLVILNEHNTSYLQTLQDEILRQILISGGHALLDKSGGIFLRRADLIQEADLRLLKTIARVQFAAEKGTLEEQIQRRFFDKELPPHFAPTRHKISYHRAEIERPELKFFNGHGGFTPDGSEYVIHLKKDEWTPCPWVNVIANNHDFGFIISESGQGHTWAENSRENRITSWSNDPVSDTSTEGIYIRDEETGSYWTPTPLPIRGSDDYLISHGLGYSTFKHCSHGIDHLLTVFASQRSNTKVSKLLLKNVTGRSRILSLTPYIELVLGTNHAYSSQTVHTEWSDQDEFITAKNNYNNEFAEHLTFFALSEKVTSFTCDRREFLGRAGNMERPACMKRKNLSNKFGANLDPCAALQTIIQLEPFQEKEICIFLGEAKTNDEIKSRLEALRNSSIIFEELSLVKNFWDKSVSAIKIQTPSESLNLLMNKWLLYQSISCRYFARSALYQSGGAFGFRDQLQDVAAFTYSRPELTRAHILLAASRQFQEGDIQHWWHPPTGRGVRTRFSDDLLWLPFIVSHYIEVTGDETILSENITYIDAPPLSEGQDESYTQPITTNIKGTLYEHCTRAIDRSLRVGLHGLPLFGSGDWNDGMNRVGHLGKGESVWMAWFLASTINSFLPICKKMNDEGKSEIYSGHLKKLKTSIEESAWDGQWYLRAFYDNGEAMGSSKNEECKIDSIAQSWSVISGFGDRERSKMAMDSVFELLFDKENKLIKLFTPPFDKSEQDPGYIKGYLPGIRENGGQYTHAAIWAMMAFAQLGDTDKASELLNLLNPIEHALDKEQTQKYKVEPYVISADIYGVTPNIGRGGWSWYTGSASWMYRAVLETILGLKIKNRTMTLNPRIPKEWNEFTLTYKKNKTTYEIHVFNHQPSHSIEIDGVMTESNEIFILEDEGVHFVNINITS